ncbi:recombination protein NinG [Pseudomonas fluorescens]|uniref:recombination protein NinG n=1 Tax=Pseudomonas fluorescens TaxID=294 RepID=UPI0006425274|nr:recombination protein NinG [Pseudomonas fluorescens]
MLAAKQPRPKKCKNPACGEQFVPARLGQAVCSYPCGLAIKEVNQEKARKSLAEVGRREIKDRKEALKTRADHLKDAQKAVNEFIRLRDKDLPCVSCGRFHEGQWHAGHFRSVNAHPELRFEPLNIWRQCAPCNTHKSGDLLNYRQELVRRIGADAVEWLEGPHLPKKYTVEQLKALAAEYRAKTKELKRAAA